MQGCLSEPLPQHWQRGSSGWEGVGQREAEGGGSRRSVGGVHRSSGEVGGLGEGIPEGKRRRSRSVELDGGSASEGESGTPSQAEGRGSEERRKGRAKWLKTHLGVEGGGTESGRGSGRVEAERSRKEGGSARGCESGWKG